MDKQEKVKRIIWSNEELYRLNKICESGWDWEFPGYQWVANSLNYEFNNNRSSASCRYWDKKIHQPEFSDRWLEIINEL